MRESDDAGTTPAPEQPVPPPGPFSGITVLDLTRVLAGPYCTMLLSDLGARIIKVERPEEGDDARHIGPFLTSDSGDEKSAYFMSLNRGKESIALDLGEEPDRAIFERLLARADVLVENFRPGAMDRHGYGWEALHERFPRLIYAAVSGFGHTGPYARRPAYDMVVQAMGGIMSLTGQPGGEPTRVGSSIGDITAGLFTAIGVSAALYHRATTGEAQKIDVGMLDAQVAILENAIARYQATGEVPGPIGARHPSITPFGAFATRDGWVVVAAGNDTLFRTLCETLARPELADRAEFGTNALRTEHERALHVLLEEAFSTADTATWLERLERSGVPCGPINDVSQVLSDPQVLARNMVVRVADTETGSFSVAGNPIKLSRFPDPDYRGPVPDLDAHRSALLSELAEEPEEHSS